MGACSSHYHMGEPYQSSNWVHLIQIAQPSTLMHHVTGIYSSWHQMDALYWPSNGVHFEPPNQENSRSIWWELAAHIIGRVGPVSSRMGAKFLPPNREGSCSIRWELAAHSIGQVSHSRMGAQNSNNPTTNCIRLGRLNQHFEWARRNWTELALTLPSNGKPTLQCKWGTAMQIMAPILDWAKIGATSLHPNGRAWPALYGWDWVKPANGEPPRHSNRAHSCCYFSLVSTLKLKGADMVGL